MNWDFLLLLTKWQKKKNLKKQWFQYIKEEMTVSLSDGHPNIEIISQKLQIYVSLKIILNLLKIENNYQ